jgi:ABC-type sugar transport system permease subunit
VSSRDHDTSAAVASPNDRWLAALFVLPTLSIVTVFVIVPFVSSTRLAFFNVDRFGHAGRYVGWRNITRVLGEPQLRSSLAATMKFLLLVCPASVVIGLLLAVFAYRPMRGVALFRVVFSSAVATGGAISAALFVVLLAPTTGALRYALQSLGLLGRNQTISLLNDNRWAIVAVAAVTVWSGLGFNFILFSAALQAVPDVLYESAAIDGCGRWRSFRHVTFPSIRPMIGFAIIGASLHAVLTFGQIDVLTRGGPGHHTDVLAYALYVASFRDNDQSKGAVYSVVLLAVCLALGGCQVLILRRRDGSDGI